MHPPRLVGPGLSVPPARVGPLVAVGRANPRTLGSKSVGHILDPS